MRRFIACLMAVGAVGSCAPWANAQIATNPNQQQQVVGVSHQQTLAQPTTQLKKLTVPASQARSIANALSLRYRELPNVRISPDPVNSHLVVMAPENAQQQIAREVQHLISQGRVRATAAAVGGPLQVSLNHIDWRGFETQLRNAAGGPLPVTTSKNGETATYQMMAAPFNGTSVQVDRRHNSVRVAGPNENVTSWRRLISLLDTQLPKPNMVRELVHVRNAEPAPVQQAVQMLRRLSPKPLQQPGANGVFQNAVFQQPQNPGGDTGTPPAENGEVPAEGGGGVIGEADIEFVPELGQIIIKGTNRDVQRIKEIIANIEKAAELTKPNVEIVQLTHTDCNAVEALLSQLYDDVLSARQGQVTITSLDSPNALMLIGRKEAIDTVKELIAKIDLPITESSRLRVFRLQNASAVDAETTIRDFFTNQPGGDSDLRPGIGPRVRVLADYRTNSLIVSASPRDMTEVTRLINDLDVVDITATNEIKIFPLNNASAETLATTLSDAITGEGDGNDNVTASSTSLSIVAVDDVGNRVVDSGILSGASITADTGANAIVVRAPSSSMPLIAELIRQLDKAPGIDSLVKVFTIENGDATQLTTALETLFGDTSNGTTVGAANTAALPGSTASSDSSLVPLRFSTDIRTNSIVASGSASDLEVVESILLRLDSEGFAERITEVIWLRHNDAPVIADAITNYVNARGQSRTAITQYQTGLGPYDLLDRDVVAIAEENSNSLLLSVSPRLYEDVRRLIDRLDRRRPMILIKVVMAEVTLDDTFELGGELGLQDSLVFNRGLAVAASPAATPGFNFNNAGVANVNSLARDTLAAGGVSTFGLGTVNPSIGYGGFVLNAASESVSLLMRTLHDANRLQVLSRPQVMAMDNTESLISVGRQVARVNGIVNNGVAGTTVSTVDIPVGMILRVTPRVSPDGLITMLVDVTRSARDPANGTLVPTGDGTGSTVFIDDLIETTAQSTLTAYSGQTVIFGGLIQKTRSNTSRRAPLLSEIPLLGNLFKYDTEAERRDELLVVMTPMLVDDAQDLEYVKESESRRMSWCLADVVEAHGDVGLSGGYGLWGPAVGNTIYPDVHPTVQNEVIISDVPSNQPVQSAPVHSAPIQSQPAYSAPVQAAPPSYPPVSTKTSNRPVAGNVVYDTPQTSQSAPPPPTASAGAKQLPIAAELPEPVIRRIAPGTNDGAQYAPVQQTGFPQWQGAKTKTAPVSWQTPVAKPAATASNATLSTPFEMPKAKPTPTRLGQATRSPAVEANQSQPRAPRGLLPKISPLSWIR